MHVVCWIDVGSAFPVAGSLVPRVSTLPGHTYLTITVDRIGVKDPQNYIDPFITVSVKSRNLLIPLTVRIH